MNATILLCTLAAAIGLPLGYFLGWCWDQLDKLAEAYIEGMCAALKSPEAWR